MRYPNISPRRHSFSFSSPAAFSFFARLFFFSSRALFVLPATFAFDLYTRFQDSSYDYQEIRDYRLIILGAVKRTNYRIELRFRLPLCVSYIETRDAIRRSCRESKNKRELSRIKAEASLLVRAKKFNLFPLTSIEATDRHF